MSRDICSADEMYLEEIVAWSLERNEELQNQLTVEDLVAMWEDSGDEV